MLEKCPKCRKGFLIREGQGVECSQCSRLGIPTGKGVYFMPLAEPIVEHILTNEERLALAAERRKLFFSLFVQGLNVRAVYNKLLSERKITEEDFASVRAWRENHSEEIREAQRMVMA